MKSAKPLRDDEIPQIFAAVFDTPSGEAVLQYLERVARFKLDKNNPNPHSAVFQVAQLELINLIRHLSSLTKKEQSHGEQQ